MSWPSTSSAWTSCPVQMLLSGVTSSPLRPARCAARRGRCAIQAHRDHHRPAPHLFCPSLYPWPGRPWLRLPLFRRPSRHR